MAILSDEFRAAPGLWSGHAQSLFGVLRRPAVTLPLRRERRPTPDGDFIDIDVLDGKPGSPTVILLHGLEGSSASGYIQLMLRELAALGWAGLAVNAIRSAAGSPSPRGVRADPGALDTAHRKKRLHSIQYLVRHRKALDRFSSAGSALDTVTV